MKQLFWSASALALTIAAGAATSAHAADAAEAGMVDEVIVTGTRATGMKAVDSPAPIQVLGSVAMDSVAQPDLVQALAQNLPSFNAQAFGGDTAQLTLSAALRGLNPNHTLVLINGKRRHGTANLSVLGGSPYSGSATADLSLIPTSAIDHIEVLQDGAAAQYGSDAIAGVVNIILKDASEGGSAELTAGQYYKGDGELIAWSFNNGMKVGENGFLNLTLEQRYKDPSQRGGVDHRYFNPDGSLKPGVIGTVNEGVADFPGAPNVNNIVGDNHYNLYNALLNGGYAFSDTLSAYVIASYSHRDADARENYRPPNRIMGMTSGGDIYYPLPVGFQPTETFVEDDFAVTVGLKGSVAGWDWDLASTYGQNLDKVYTKNSGNKVYFLQLSQLSPTPIDPQRDFYDGQFKASEWTTNLDVVREFDVGMASPLNVAFGAEYRENKYSIGAGEPASYLGDGAQSFPGYSPPNASDNKRHDYALYVDLSGDLIEGLHIDLAGRYSSYSDFGDATVGKLTARYDFNPAFAIRGTAATGFRAPTLAEEFYSGTNVAPNSVAGQLPPNSPASLAAGFDPLDAEKSVNYSLGFVTHPMDSLSLTVDVYQIEIDDRIQTTGFLYGFETVDGVKHIISQTIIDALLNRGTVFTSDITYAGINVFTNAVDTRTRGLEATVSYASDFDDYGHVDWSAALNINETKIRSEKPLPTQLQSTDPVRVQDTILNDEARTGLTSASPKWRAVLGAYWTLGAWSVNLRESIYGESKTVTTAFTPTELKIGTAAITDLTVSYKLTEHIKLEGGANNLFNKKPPTVPYSDTYGYQIDGGNVRDAPMTFSPYGINGGYYYGRVTLTF